MVPHLLRHEANRHLRSMNRKLSTHGRTAWDTIPYHTVEPMIEIRRLLQGTNQQSRTISVCGRLREMTPTHIQNRESFKDGDCPAFSVISHEIRSEKDSVDPHALLLEATVTVISRILPHPEQYPCSVLQMTLLLSSPGSRTNP